jgi:DDE superfamily endonuclease
MLGVQPPRVAGPTHDAHELRPSDGASRIRAQKKRPRPSELDRPDVAAKRAAFVTWIRQQNPNRLVFLDEAGANLAMGRSHAWVKRGEEYVEARPMNWGDNLTLIGAIRRRGWVVLNTKWHAMNKIAFIEWVRDRLARVCDAATSWCSTICPRTKPQRCSFSLNNAGPV